MKLITNLKNREIQGIRGHLGGRAMKMGKNGKLENREI